MKCLIVFFTLVFSGFVSADVVFDATANEYQSLAEVENGFHNAGEELLARGDARGVFMKVYEQVIHRTEQMLQQNYFEDPVWVRQIGLTYANYFRRAFLSYNTYQSSGYWTETLVSPWWLAFSENRLGDLAVPVQFILSTNAHIQNDLPHALIDSGADFSDRCHRDYQRIGEIFRGSFEESWQVVYRLDQHNRSSIERTLGSWMAQNWIAIFRDTAWKNAVKLSKQQTTPAQIEQQAYKAGLGYRTLDFWAR